jgi:hypothetical protein
MGVAYSRRLFQRSWVGDLSAAVEVRGWHGDLEKQG